MNKALIAIAVLIFCSFATVLSMFALQQPVQAAVGQAESAGETQQQCVQRVQTQYKHIADNNATAQSDAYETALLLCKF